MTDSNYTSIIKVAVPTERAFAAVTDEIHRWWSDMVAGNSTAGHSLAVIFGQTAKLLRIVERQDNQQLVWECLDVLMPDPTSDYPHEWRGTRMIWTFEKTDEGCAIRLTHEGLSPALKCYETCQTAWTFFVTESLKAYLETGKGDPHVNGRG